MEIFYKQRIYMYIYIYAYVKRNKYFNNNFFSLFYAQSFDKF